MVRLVSVGRLNERCAATRPPHSAMIEPRGRATIGQHGDGFVDLAQKAGSKQRLLQCPQRPVGAAAPVEEGVLIPKPVFADAIELLQEGVSAAPCGVFEGAGILAEIEIEVTTAVLLTTRAPFG